MESQDFITTAEVAAIDGALLSTHEKFLARITISSLRLLVKIAADRGTPIAELTPEEIIAWLEVDSQRRMQEGDAAAALQW
jgi:hypothetical protein